MTLHHYRWPTPAGAPWSVVVHDGVVVASGFTTVESLVERLPVGLAEQPLRRLVAADPVAGAARAYLAGDLDALDAVAVRQSGGPFQRQVWLAMRGIPAGETWSYAELATKAGRPTASRAAGTACARNLLAPFVPCHRVVRSDGSLGGYAYGLDVKRWLLGHERGVR